MASYNKFQDYVEQLNKAKHDWSTHGFTAILTNSAPVATNTVAADITQISTGNGYTQFAAGANGLPLDTVTLSEATGTAKVTIADEVLTASGGPIGPFRYVVILNRSTGTPAYPLVCWYDYGVGGVTLADGETFTIDFDPTNGLWQMT
jgi:hypothetical protein